MTYLAIDSSGLACSVALFNDDKMIAGFAVDFKKTHSETLLPMIDEVFSLTEKDRHELDYIACAAGPGSFTGLRIGAATAKGIGLALEKPIVPVSTLLGLSYNGCLFSGNVVPLMDARRGQVYTGIFRYEDGGKSLPVEVLPPCAVPIEEVLEEVNKDGRPALFLGDGASVFSEKINELVKNGITFAPSFLMTERAGAVGAVSKLLYERGDIVSADDFRPEYLRLSQAERERLEREDK